MAARTATAPAMQEELSFFGFLTSEQRACLPDWLVIAPPKTGTSWLYANLREHPAAFVPPIKELKYFSHRFEVEDLRSYLDHFRKGVEKSKGEASPSYSMLPRRTIRMMRRLMPDLKLIYMMRDPVERAWSHARHSFCQGEANFKECRGTIDDVADDDWIINFDDDWNRLSGDYLGQLKRWLSVFPREQVYLGFFEDLVESPRKFLREVLEFLGLDPGFADSSAVTLDAVNVGLPRAASPRLRRHLRAMYAGRTAELADYLDREFQLRVPAAWTESLGTAVVPVHSVPSAIPEPDLPERALPAGGRSWEVDDDTLSRLLARDDLLAMDFLGFNIVRRDGSFMAYRITLGVARPDHFDLSWWQQQAAQGNCFFADNPYDLKSMIVRQTITREVPPGSDTARLRQLELECDRLFRRQIDGEGHLTDFKDAVTRDLAPLELVARRQAAAETALQEFKNVVAGEFELQLTGLRRELGAGLDPLHSSQARLEEQLTHCVDQMREFQVQLRSARQRVRKLHRNRIIRFLRWLDVCLPWRRSRPPEADLQSGWQSWGHIVVYQEGRHASKATYAKHPLPSLERSGISPANCLNPTS